MKAWSWVVAASVVSGAAHAGTLVEVAGQKGFTTLGKALEVAGLVDTLANGGPFTVFAPTDEAFAALPPATLKALLADPPALKRVLLHHVAKGDVRAADVVGFDSVRTLAGEALAIDAKQSTVGGAKLLATDVAASNGVIHVIDRVLVPGAETYRVADYFPAAPRRVYTYARTLKGRFGRSERSTLTRTGSPGPEGLVRFNDSEGEFLDMGMSDGRPVMGAQTMRDQGFEQYYDPPIPLFPSEATVGKAQTYASSIKHTTRSRTYEGTLERTVELLGVEDIETPAGVFKGCLKFRATSTNRPYGKSRPFVARSVETIWLAKGVGEVKNVNRTTLESLRIPWLKATITLSLKDYADPAE